MDLAGLTTAEEIRSALGIDPNLGELPDSVFDDMNMEDLLMLEIYSWLPRDVSQIKSASEAAANEYDRPRIAYRALRAAAQYYGAYLFVLSSPFGFAERLEDNNNKMKRQAHNYQKILEDFMNLYLKFKALCLDSLEEMATAAPVQFIGSSRPSYDPVTNRMQ